MGPRSKGGASPLSLKLKKLQAAGKIQCLGRMGELMRLYRQERATRGQQGRFRAFVGSLSHRRKKRGLLGPSRGRVPFARRVLPAEKEKAADSQLIILMWKAEGFLLASDFSEELSKTFSSQLVSTWGERCGEGGDQSAARGSQLPAQVLLYKTCPAKGRTTPLEREPLGSAQIAGQFI